MLNSSGQNCNKINDDGGVPKKVGDQISSSKSPRTSAPIKFAEFPTFSKGANNSMPWRDLAETITTSKEFATKDASKRRTAFIGGTLLRDNASRENNVDLRTALTLDFDQCQGDINDIELHLSFSLPDDLAVAAHTTFSHTDEAPRVRVVVPLSRGVNEVEHTAILKRFIAEHLPAETFGKPDGCSFTFNALMFRASHREGTKPWRYISDGETPLDADDWLTPTETLPALDNADDLALAVQNRPLDLSDDDVREILALRPAKACDYGQWALAGMALWHQYGGSEEGFKKYKAWSALDPDRYDGEAALRKKWKSFEHKGQGKPVTMASLIKLTGWKRPKGSNIADDDLSDDALALEFGRKHFDENARYDVDRGVWVFWNGQVWETRKLHEYTVVRELLRQKAEKAPDQKKSLLSKHRVANVESLIRSNTASLARSSDFDSDTLLLGTPGGTVDLRTGTLRPARRSDMITKLVAVTPMKGKPTRCLEFIKEAGQDPEFMQRLCGYALTGSVREQKFFFLYGTGGNGKSVFLNTLSGIAGDYFARMPARALMARRHSEHSTEIAGLAGARFVTASEIPAGQSWNEPLIKDLTGGEMIAARKMRADYSNFKPQMTLMIAGNHQPRIGAVDPAMRRRMVLIPFATKVPNPDPKLEEKLREEWPYILNWMIQGAVRWQKKDGLAIPEEVVAASDEYLDDQDVIGQFIEDCVEDAPGGFVTTTSAFNVYLVWCSENHQNPVSRDAFQKSLKERGFAPHRKTSGRGFKDITVNANECGFQGLGG